ncbi:unnamed protein product [Durusdinium trenchii]|uniref:Uncharacterized protein n=1 Tax=Durusdinium trenchii TaxID=1381693 RepID=A0ABP0HIB5_9DINO
METDAVPVQESWIDQFIQEALHYPRAAIRGSRYRGDRWDSIEVPEDLLLHLNGNAIYNLRHPWLEWLHGQLEREHHVEDFAVIPFDLRMGNITRAAQRGVDPLGGIYAALVPGDEEPYKDDSTLIGSFAGTLLNHSFQTGVYVRQASLSNIFQNLEDELTLGVAAPQPAYDGLNATIRSRHPFRKILVLSYGEKPIKPDGSMETIETPRGPTDVLFQSAMHQRHLALCEMASLVTTTFFAFSDVYHLISGPVDVLAEEGRPVLPYITTSSRECTAKFGCKLSVLQAENLFHVDLHHHYDTFEVLYLTSQMRRFCSEWQLAVKALGSYEDCAVQFGPTADDYIAWHTSVGIRPSHYYVPKDKDLVGWRSMTHRHEAEPTDARHCSAYTQEEYKSINANITICSKIVEDAPGMETHESRKFFGERELSEYSHAKGS